MMQARSLANHPVADHSFENALLVLAHPGHELRLYGWLALTRPDVVILTDGSGRNGNPRTHASHRVLDEVEAYPTSIFGRYTDQRIYRALLDHDYEFFLAIAAELALILQSKSYSVVVADPLEGYNPTHDLCKVLVDAAIERTTNHSHNTICTYDYRLMEIDTPQASDEIVNVRLTKAMLQRKIKAALSYEELADEVTRAMRKEGIASQATERLRPACAGKYTVRRSPFYESYGEQQYAMGRYSEVIRYGEHFLPVVHALATWAKQEYELS